MRTPHHRPLQVVAGPPWRVAWDPHGPFRTPCRPHPHVATSVPRAPTSTPTQHRVRSSPTPPRTPHLHPPHTRDEVPRGRRQSASTTASTPNGTPWRAAQRRVATALPAPITNTAPHPREARGETSPRPSAAPAPTTAAHHRKPTRVRRRRRFRGLSPPCRHTASRGPTSAIVATSECPSRGPTRNPPRPLVETW